MADVRGELLRVVGTNWLRFGNVFEELRKAAGALQMINRTIQQNGAIIVYDFVGDNEKEVLDAAKAVYELFKDGYAASWDQEPALIMGKWRSRVSRLSHCD